MVTLKTVLRGEIWIAELDPTIGSEIRKARPCLIISPDVMNRHLRTVIGMPMTTGSRSARFRIPVRFQNRDGLLLGDQLRTLDRQRLTKCVGVVDTITLAAALAILREMFAD